MGKINQFVANAKVKVAAGAAAALGVLAPGMAFAAEGEPTTAMTTVTTALGTSIQDVANSIGTAVGTNLPIILGVAAIFIVIPAVWRLAKRFTK